MSIRHQSAIWEDGYYQQGDKAKLLVALAIADSARSEDGHAWPSIEYLARKARTSVRGVQEACRELEQDGRLTIKNNGGPYGTNLYKIVEVTPQPLHPPRNGAAEKAARKAAEIPADDCTQSVSNGNGAVNSLQEPTALASGGVHKKFIEDWMSYYQKKFGAKYSFQSGNDGKAVKTLLAHFGNAEDAKAFIKSCHARMGDGYPFKNASTLSFLADNISLLQASLTQPAKTANGYHGTETASARHSRKEAGQYGLEPGLTPIFNPGTE